MWERQEQERHIHTHAHEHTKRIQFYIGKIYVQSTVDKTLINKVSLFLFCPHNREHTNERTNERASGESVQHPLNDHVIIYCPKGTSCLSVIISIAFLLCLPSQQLTLVIYVHLKGFIFHQLWALISSFFCHQKCRLFFFFFSFAQSSFT